MDRPISFCVRMKTSGRTAHSLKCIMFFSETQSIYAFSSGGVAIALPEEAVKPGLGACGRTPPAKFAHGFLCEGPGIDAQTAPFTIINNRH